MVAKDYTVDLNKPLVAQVQNCSLSSYVICIYVYCLSAILHILWLRYFTPFGYMYIYITMFYIQYFKKQNLPNCSVNYIAYQEANKPSFRTINVQFTSRCNVVLIISICFGSYTLAFVFSLSLRQLGLFPKRKQKLGSPPCWHNLFFACLSIIHYNCCTVHAYEICGMFKHHRLGILENLIRNGFTSPLLQRKVLGFLRMMSWRYYGHTHTHTHSFQLKPFLNFNYMPRQHFHTLLANLFNHGDHVYIIVRLTHAILKTVSHTE